MSTAQGWTLIAVLIALLLAEGGLVLRLVRAELRVFSAELHGLGAEIRGLNTKLDALVAGLDRRLQLLEDRP
jgi:hypothetical protein